ncbi:hypothetical protein CISG_02742 [Coccidioides immitis RMSCC 3703]|uniref:NodB homology domain-containing protein n=2 Tax=Coccidioides immitis TaxID=5501 RepID=A0A0J8R9I8_COCIT|nr:hypothetical protein CIRG_00331 [Coccidioides immitis RMSCC 2394]KMU81724.1 hypothetical protein CISG_02742 [Coccidioides immitis RMSCC 3703]
MAPECLVAVYRAVTLCLALLNISIFAAPMRPFVEPLVIDTFDVPGSNNLGGWAGPDEGMPAEYGPGYLHLTPSDPDMNFHTRLGPYCLDMSEYMNMYLHISFSGTDKFTVSLTQNNEWCDQTRAPYPETWDSLEAARYSAGGDIYMPLHHFNIDFSRVNSVAFNGFYTREPAILYKVEITSDVPEDFEVPVKLPSGTLAVKCKRPNSFAFGIDDGRPEFAQEVIQILEEEHIKVTFFTVGNGLLDQTSNFTETYRDMLSRGHQVALHTFSHPAVEGLSSLEEIDSEITENIKVMKEQLGIESRYFRPPFGVVGARTRQRLAEHIENPYIITWSVDIEDWLWAHSPTPEKQYEAFKRDLEKGGDLAVMHFLHRSTVDYFKDVFQLVKASGKQIMRVDQCMEDPDAPPLKDSS